MNTHRDFFKLGKTMAAVGPVGPPTLGSELGWDGESIQYTLPDPENVAEYEWLGGAPPAPVADVALEGGARSTINAPALVAEATRPDEEAWVNLRDAIDTGTIATSEIHGVLSEIIRILAKGPEQTSAYKNDELVLTKFLRDGGGDKIKKIYVDGRGPFGETALMQAAVNGRAKHVEALIKAGANVNAQNSQGETALMWAAAYNESDVIKALKKAKANEKLKDNLGWTALMVASWAGSPEAVELLKSTKKETNNDGFTASDLSANDKAPVKTKPREVGESIRKTLKKGYFGGVTQRNRRSKTKRTRPTKR